MTTVIDCNRLDRHGSFAPTSMLAVIGCNRPIDHLDWLQSTAIDLNALNVGCDRLGGQAMRGLDATVAFASNASVDCEI